MARERVDTKEFEIPETVFERDIDDRVFQSIVLQTLSKIEGIGLTEGNLFNQLLGREFDKIKGISIRQDSQSKTVFAKIEINVAYGVSIPEKSEEIQSRVTQELTRLTGLHVGGVHVIFKNLISDPGPVIPAHPYGVFQQAGEHYSDEF